MPEPAGVPTPAWKGAKTIFGAEILNFGGKASPATPNHCPGCVALTGGCIPCPVPPPCPAPRPAFPPGRQRPADVEGPQPGWLLEAPLTLSTGELKLAAAFFKTGVALKALPAQLGFLLLPPPPAATSSPSSFFSGVLLLLLWGGCCAFLPLLLFFFNFPPRFFSYFLFFSPLFVPLW